jgi:N utilization substance protein A
MKNEFALAFNEVLEDRQLPKEVVLEALEAAMVSAYRRAVNASNAQHVEAKIDLLTGQVSIFAEKEIVEVVQDERTEVALEDAQEVDEEAIMGGMVVVETTPKNFGRVAAQTARQVIQQRIREAERDAQMNYYGKQVGEIVNGVVQALNAQAVTLGLDMKAEGIMPRSQQIPGERFRVHDRVRALLLEVKSSPRGPQIILSRAHKNFLRRLLENEVPEIYHGLVEIRSIAREPGHRSKVAVAALQPGVDPVGACVGIRGVRIQAIVRELSDEKIDVIEYNTDPGAYIAKALSPARVTGVYLDEHAKGTKTATVVVPEDQLSLAIGRDGQNARLGAKLTAWRIDIKSLPEAAIEARDKLQNLEEYAEFAEQEAEIIPQIEMTLAKKAEGRPVTPEEYQLMSQFVDRIERGLRHQRELEREAEKEKILELRATIPSAAFDMPIEESGISLRFTTILAGSGYSTMGDLKLQWDMDPDVILGLEGIGPKAMEDIATAFETVTFPEDVEEPVLETEVEEEAVAEDEAEITEVVEAEAPEADIEEVEVTEVEAAPEEAEPVDLEPEAEVAEAEALTEIEEEEPASFEELFTLQPEVFEMVESLEGDELEADEAEEKKKKKKRKKRYVEMEYDPDADYLVVKKKRKRSGESDWDEDWDI